MRNINHLFIDIQEGSLEKVQAFLLEKGIDVVDDFNRTALMNAVLYNKTDLVSWLIHQNANLNLQDKNGYTALHFSAQEAHTECTRLLLNNGANPNIGDHHNNTAAFVTIVNWKAGENFDTLKELIANKVNLTLKNKSNRAAIDLIPSAIRKKLDLYVIPFLRLHCLINFNKKQFWNIRFYWFLKQK